MINKLKELRETGSEEGFTLIELMIVVVIIGILAAIAIPIFMNQQKAAIVAGVKSDVKNTVTNVATALVKSPTAATIGGAAGLPNSGTGAATSGKDAGTAGTATFDIVVSDANTRVALGGAWNGYWVLGINVSVAPGAIPGTVTLTATSKANTVLPTTGNFGVLYNSLSGATTVTGG